LTFAILCSQSHFPSDQRNSGNLFVMHHRLMRLTGSPWNIVFIEDSEILIQDQGRAVSCRWTFEYIGIHWDIWIGDRMNIPGPRHILHVTSNH
jgi:hypothetical protein